MLPLVFIGLGGLKPGGPILGLPTGCRNRPALEVEDGVGGGKLGA